MDFIKKHKVLFIVIGVVLAIFIVMCCIRAINLSKKANEPAPEVSQTVPETPIEEEEQETEQSDYQSSLSIKAKEEESKKEEAEKRLAENVLKKNVKNRKRKLRKRLRQLNRRMVMMLRFGVAMVFQKYGRWSFNQTISR